MAREGKPPAYQHYPADYLSDEETATMTLEEEGAFRRLLDYHWREGSIPADPEQLRRLLKWIPMAKFRRLWPALARCFSADGTGQRLVNERLAAQRQELDAFREAQAERGRKGAETKWAGHGERHQSAIPHAIEAPLLAGGSAICDLRSATADQRSEEAVKSNKTGQGSLFAVPKQSPAASTPPSSTPADRAEGKPHNATQGAQVDRHFPAARQVLAELEAARKRVIPGARALRPTYDRLAGIAGQLEAGATAADCLHVIASYEAEIRAGNGKTADYFDAVSPWRPANFQRHLDRDPTRPITPATAAAGGRPNASNHVPDFTDTEEGPQ